MFKPALYQKTNSLPKQESLACLIKYGSKMEWQSGASVIDLGCGDGSVTVEVLKKFLPQDFKRVVGCDIGEQMVEYANQQYGDSRTSFIVLDLTSANIPPALHTSFDHAFSSYAIHWMQDQEKVFENIHKLLVEGGNCLLLFIGRTLVYDFYRGLAQHPRWKNLLRDAEKYISPYQDLQEPEKRIHSIMAQVGFNNINVICEDRIHNYNENDFRNTMEAISPFDVAAELREQFMEDYMQVVRDLKATKQEDGKTVITMRYTLITAYGIK